MMERTDDDHSSTDRCLLYCIYSLQFQSGPLIDLISIQLDNRIYSNDSDAVC